jgi:hypothetical protein
MEKNGDKKTVLPYDKLYETPDSTDCAGKVVRAAGLTTYFGMNVLE